jgi:alpha-L-arabinofuranosidase
LKVVNPTDETADVELNLEGNANLESTADAIVLQGNPEDENSLEHPVKIVPAQQTLDVTPPRFHYAFAPNSLTVLQFAVKNN